MAAGTGQDGGTPSDKERSGAGESRRRWPSFGKVWTRGVDGLAALGTLMIVALMVMICSDVVARNMFGGSLPLVSELGALTVVMIVFLQLGTSVRNGRLARTDFFLESLAGRAPRPAAFFSGLWEVVGAGVCTGIGYSTYGILHNDISHGEFIGVTGVLTLQTWPFRALILLGATVATVEFLIQAFRSFSAAAQRLEPTE